MILQNYPQNHVSLPLILLALLGPLGLLGLLGLPPLVSLAALLLIFVLHDDFGEGVSG